MARIRVFIVLVLAVTAGGALALGTYNYMQKAQGRVTSMPTRNVVVSKANLDVGADLTKDDVKTIEWPATAVPAGAFRPVGGGAGRGLIRPGLRKDAIVPVKLAATEGGG